MKPPEAVRKERDRPFYLLTKRDTGGTGLGLSISSNIIKAINGTITVDTSAQKGTVFKVTIPAFV
jgi:polar amino acid transport system substrate-binding protein